jgi:hypothetical protein
VRRRRRRIIRERMRERGNKKAKNLKIKIGLYLGQIQKLKRSDD